MTTLITVENANFSENLPRANILHTVAGLLAGWRFTGQSPTIDISGNEATLTAGGAPMVNENSVIVDLTNHYLTSVNETENLTIMGVARARVNPGDTPDNSWIFGSYSTSAGEGEAGCYMQFRENDGGGVLDVRVGSERVDGSSNSYHINSDYTVPGTLADNAEKWFFYAFVLDQTANEVRLYLPEIDSVSPVFTQTSIRLLDGRNLTDVNTDPIAFRIGRPRTTSPGTGTPGESEQSEILFYNSALTSEQITKQYDLSKSFWAVEGIAI